MSILAKIRRIKNSKEGFTLVELVVVLVILATLLAILIPGMFGWINRAKEKQITVEARSAYIAVQSFVSEEYAKPAGSFEAIQETVNSEENIEKIRTLANVSGTISDIQLDGDGKISKMSYAQKNETIKWTDGNWELQDN